MTKLWTERNRSKTKSQIKTEKKVGLLCVININKVNKLKENKKKEKKKKNNVSK